MSDSIVDLFDDMKRKKKEKPLLASVNITTSLVFSLKRIEEKNILQIEDMTFIIPDNSHLYVLEDKVYVDGKEIKDENSLEIENERIIGTSDKYKKITLNKKNTDIRIKILGKKEALDYDRIDKRIPLSSYLCKDEEGREFTANVFRIRRERKRYSTILYGTMEIYAHEDDDDLTVSSLIQETLDRCTDRIYFLPFYDEKTIFVLGRRKMITDDPVHIDDPNYFYVKKGSHPIKAFKNAFFSYLRPKIIEVGRRMGLDLTKWEVQVIDSRTFFAANYYGKTIFKFDYRNFAFSPLVLEGLVIHEVAHCYHHNHGPRFYSLCESHIRNYKYYEGLLMSGVLSTNYLSEKDYDRYVRILDDIKE